MVKLSDIAKEMGISVATVSNALTGKGRMSEHTKQEILDKATELGYKWTPRKNKVDKYTFLIIIEGFSLVFTSKILQGINEQAHIRNVNTPIFLMNLPKENAKNVPSQVLNAEIDKIISNYNSTIAGIIYVSLYPRKIEGLFKKYFFRNVSLFCTREDDCPVVHYDDHQGAYLAVSHLIKNGCKHIAMISGPIDSIGMFHRSSGYQRALVDNGLSYNPKLVRVSDWNTESSYALTKQLLDEVDEIDAIFAQNDYMAVGALHAIKEKGLRCPEDISIVGFDDISLAQYSDPPISSIAPPFEEMGHKAVDMLIDLLDGKPIENSFIKCELVERDSVKKS